MDELKALLKENFPTIDFDNEKNLTSDDLLDSLAVVSVIYLLRSNFNVNVSIDDMDAKNFESVESIWNLIEKLRNK